jgi:hypothetical protein
MLDVKTIAVQDIVVVAPGAVAMHRAHFQKPKRVMKL